METNIQEKFTSNVWSERVLIVTQDYEIRGYVFMPKTGKRTRVLSDILNSPKKFIAIKDCEITYRNILTSKPEYQKFIQLNLSSIILLRPDGNQNDTETTPATNN